MDKEITDYFYKNMNLYECVDIYEFGNMCDERGISIIDAIYKIIGEERKNELFNEQY